MKSPKKYKAAHTDNTKYGMGDFYGRAIPAKVGKIRSVYVPGQNNIKPKSLKKPPKSLA